MKKSLTLTHPGRRDLLIVGGSLAVLPLVSSLPVLAQTPADTKIGVIGSGRLGGAVGTIFAKAGYKVMFSSRHPEELKDLVAKAGPNASADTVQQAIAFGNVILLAVPYKALPDVGREHGAALKGKIVLDACNPIPARDGEIGNEGQKNGPGETTLKYLPGIRLVRAFNSFGGRIFATGDRNTAVLGDVRRHGAGEDDGDSDRGRAQLGIQPLGEQLHGSLARAIDRLAGHRREAGDSMQTFDLGPSESNLGIEAQHGEAGVDERASSRNTTPLRDPASLTSQKFLDRHPNHIRLSPHRQRR